MKKLPFALIIIILGITAVVITSTQAHAHVLVPLLSGELRGGVHSADILTTPTPVPSVVVTAVSSDRQLPPVGKNAGLVLGASVLVLIIIGGVLGFRKRTNRQAKH